MTEWQKIIWAAIFTIIGGFLIYVIGRIIEKGIVEPLSDYNKVISKIDEDLIYYSNKYSNPGSTLISENLYIEASQRLRRVACEFKAKYRRVNTSYFLTNKFVLTKNNADKVSSDLFGLSNALFDERYLDENLRRSEEIRTILKI